MRAAKAARESRTDSKEGKEELVVPEKLVKAIREGNCVAFVGAGFSGAARLPGWAQLLESILEEGCKQGLDDAVATDITNMIKGGKFEQAAQALETKCGRDLIAEVLGEKLKPPEQLPPDMMTRLLNLFGIPFSAILTTNFDYFLPGPPAAHESSKPLMRDILRSSPLSLVEQMIREIMMTMPYMEQYLDEDEEFQKKVQACEPEGDESEDELDKIDIIMQAAQDKGMMTKQDVKEARLKLKGDGEEEELKQFLVSKVGEDKLEELASTNLDDDDSGSDVDMEEVIPGLPILQLHGTVVPQGGEGAMLDGLPHIAQLFAKNDYRKNPGLAFTQLGYRNLLHGNAYYSSFLASLMATKTILYIGFSFSDAYINEKRSETMMLLEENKVAKEQGDEEDAEEEGKKKEKDPIAYAIAINAQKTEMELYRGTEGLEFLNYVPKDGGPGFEGVEKWLKEIHDRTNPIYRWSRCLKGKKLLVCASGKMQAFIRIAHVFAQKQFGGDLGTITHIPTPEGDIPGTEIREKIKECVDEAGTVDLVLVGWKAKKHPIAQYFLSVMDSLGEQGKNSPVVVLGTSPKLHAAHKKESMRMGAAGYAGNLREAFEAIMHVLEKPRDPEKYEKECAIL